MTKDFVTIKVSVATREKVRLYARESGLAMCEAVGKGVDLLGKLLIDEKIKVKRCVICQKIKEVAFDGYCQQCHDEIAERNIRLGSGLL